MSAKKISPVASKQSVADIVQQVNDVIGKDAISVFSSIKNIDERMNVIPSGILAIDIATGIGGYPAGRIVEIFGQEGCLDQDSFIQYTTFVGNRVENSKGGTIRSLYERFHGVNCKYPKRKFSAGAAVYINSINGADRIVKNKIADVVYSGKKQCFVVTTRRGKKLTCTKDHKFYIGAGQYSRLEEMSVGDDVYIHTNKPFSKHKKGKRKFGNYAETTVKYHPNFKAKTVNGCDYHRGPQHILVYEASMNGMSYIEYRHALNTWPKSSINKLWTKPESHDIHHIDMDSRNNDITNLMLIDKKSHGRLHAMLEHNNLRYEAYKDCIVGIDNVGIKDTYDIKCHAPYHNYVANGIVVHNSGKSLIGYRGIVSVQQSGGVAALIDTEKKCSTSFMQLLGIDTDALVYSRENNAAAVMKLIETMASTGQVDLIVVDSAAALITDAISESDYGDANVAAIAKFMSSSIPKLLSTIADTKTTVIFINQERMKPMVMFGPNTESTGGKALKYYSTIRIRVNTGSMIKIPIVDPLGNKDAVVGHTVNIYIPKNQAGPPHKHASFDIYYTSGVDYARDILHCGLFTGLITKSTSWYNVGDKKFNGDTQVLKYIKETPELYAKVHEKMLKITGATLFKDHSLHDTILKEPAEDAKED